MGEGSFNESDAWPPEYVHRVDLDAKKKRSALDHSAPHLASKPGLTCPCSR